MDGFLHASLDNGEAVLSFPYDDRLRKILRAIPGRRWDPARGLGSSRSTPTAPRRLRDSSRGSRSRRS